MQGYFGGNDNAKSDFCKIHCTEGIQTFSIRLKFKNNLDFQ